MTGSVISRYEMCLVAEDLLLEDFPEPENKDEVTSKLLTKLGFHNRWALSGIEVEILCSNGSTIFNELQLDAERFQLVAVPPDFYTHLGEPGHFRFQDPRASAKPGFRA